MASTLERDICSILVEALHRVDIVSAMPIEKGITLRRGEKDGEFNLSIIIYVLENDCVKESVITENKFISLLELDENKDVNDSLGNISFQLLPMFKFEYLGKGQFVPKNVTHVRFHPSVANVDRKAFEGCTELREAVLNDGLRVIGKSAFSGCLSLRSVKLPSTVTEIGMCAFCNCYSLREVILNAELKKIEKSAFEDCISLQSIVVPSTADKISLRAFYGCTNLLNVILKEGIKRIGYYHTFARCTSLESIVMPSTVTYIGAGAFSHCTNLREVVIHNEEVQIDDRAFKHCTSLERFNFPSLFTRLDNIIQAGQRGIEAKLDDIPAVEWRGGELVIPCVHQEIEEPWGKETIVEVDKEKLNKIISWISYYEIKEATTLFELSLWKARIDQVDDADEINRDAQRIEVPGPVKDTILQYLREHITLDSIW